MSCLEFCHAYLLLQVMFIYEGEPSESNPKPLSALKDNAEEPEQFQLLFRRVPNHI